MAFRRIAQLFVLLFSLCFSTAALSQSLTGTPPFNSFAGEINEGNLNVHLSIPIFSRNGFTYALKYDSNFWNPNPPSGASWWPTRAPVTSLDKFGWHGTFNNSIPAAPVSGVWYDQINPGTCGSRYDRYTYVDTSGTQHPFPLLFPSSCTPTWTTKTLNATDGSGYSVTFTVNGNGGYNISVKDIGGNTFVAPVPVIGGSNPGSVTDPNNNTVSISADGNTFTDTLGPAFTVTHPTGQDVYLYTGGNGAASVKVIYSTINYSTAFGCYGINETSGSISLPTSIQYYDGGTLVKYYSFSYDGYGRLNKMVLPTGGTIKYAYTGVNCADGSPNTVTKTTPDSTVPWTYTRTVVNNTSTTTITAPSGDHTVVQFAFYQEVLRKVYTGAISGTPLEQVIHCYNYSSAQSCGSASGPTNGVQAGLSPQALSVLHQFNGGANDLTFTTYPNTDASGNRLPLPYEIDSYDFGASSPTRRQFINYGSDNNAGSCLSIGGNILNRPCWIRTYDSGPTLYSWNVRSYDPKGNLTLSKDDTGSVWLQTTYTHYANGAVNTVQDPNGTVTTYGSMTCNGFFPQSISSTAVGWTTSAAYDCAGGVVASVTGPNGAADFTSYTYHDPFWRVTDVQKPWQGGNPTTVSTRYLNPTSFYTYQTENGGASQPQSLTVLDGLGRTSVLSKNYSSNQYSSVSYAYDTNGRVSSISNPCSSANYWTPCTGPGTSYTGYDGLNRVGKVTDGFGGYVSYTYNINDVLATLGPSPLYSKQYQHDALGRLASVCEVSSQSGSGACGQSTSATGFLTSYGYDAAGRLLNINQHGEQRNFQHDLVGRLTQESNPESGTKTYTYDSQPSGVCWSSNSKGDLTMSTDAAGNTTCFLYDGLHRLTDGGGWSNSNWQGPCHRFRYDSGGLLTAPGTVSNSNGRMIEAETDNAGGTCGLPLGTITDEWFSYADSGKVTDIYQSSPNSGGYLHTTASYFEDGQLNTLSGVPGLAQSWTYGLDNVGHTNQVSDNSGAVVSGITYNPDRSLSTVTYSNGSDSYGYDAAGRMNAFSYSVAGGTAYSGNLTWNQNGTLGTMQITNSAYSGDNQSCNYSYDDLVRLMGADCGTMGSQAYSYDSFGNVSKTANGLGSSFQALYNNNNQITNMGSLRYDGNGNIVEDQNQLEYMYDPNWQTLTGFQTCPLCPMHPATSDAFGRMVEYNSQPILYSPVGKLGVLATGGSYSTGAKIHIPSPAGTLEYIKGTNTSARLIHPDWLGSGRFTSNPGNNTAAAGIEYTPFGESYNLNGTKPARDFTGQISEVSENDKYDFPARRYDAGQGRWLVPDPTLGNLANPQSFNKYAYVSGNPLGLTDPSGLCEGDGACSESTVSSNAGASGDQSDSTVLTDCVDFGCHGAELSNGAPTSDAGTITVTSTMYSDLEGVEIQSQATPNVADMVGLLKDAGSYISEPVQGLAGEIVVGAIGEKVTSEAITSSDRLRNFTKEWVSIRRSKAWTNLVGKEAKDSVTGVVGGRNEGFGGELNPAQFAQFQIGKQPSFLNQFLDGTGPAFDGGADYTKIHEILMSIQPMTEP